MSNKTEKEIKVIKEIKRIFKESEKQELLESLERIMKLTEKTKTIPPKEYPYEEELYSYVHSHMWHESNLGDTYANSEDDLLKNESIETRYMMSKVMIDLLLENSLEILEERGTLYEHSIDGRYFQEKLIFFHGRCIERLNSNADIKECA